MQSKYTGDVAYYATMMALLQAIKSASIMLAKPNPIIGKSVEILQELVRTSVSADIRTRLSSPDFALLMQNYIANCGLNTMAVLQLVKKFENELAKHQEKRI